MPFSELWPDWLTESTPPPPVALVVLERRGEWAAPLRSVVSGLAVPVRETRSPAECLEVLAQHPASVVAVELGRGRLPLINTLVHEGPERFPAVRWVVLSRRGPELAVARWLELGATYVTSSPRKLTPVRSIVARQMLDHPAPASDPLARWLPDQAASHPSP